MEKGLIFALFSALCFGGSLVSLRRGVLRTGEPFTAVLISVVIGLTLLLFWLPFTDEWDKLWSLSWQGFILLGIAGITHFVIGRLLISNAVRLIGANRTSPILQTNPFYAVTLGILFLHEPLTTLLIPGVLCLVVGATMVSIEKEGKVVKMQGKGILNVLGAALFWGTSGVLVRPVIGEIGSSSAAVFISYIAAFIVVVGLLLRKEQRIQLVQLHRASLIPLIISGILSFLGQLLRYEALSYSPVSVVAPLTSTTVFFVFLLSFILNRNIEVFTWKILAGMVATAVGVFLLFQ